MKNAVQIAKEKHGGLNVAVNCAGIGIAKRTLTKKGPHPLEEFQRVLQVSLCILSLSLSLIVHSPSIHTYIHIHVHFSLSDTQVNSAGTFNVIRLTAEQMSNGEPYNKAGERGTYIDNVVSIAPRFFHRMKTCKSQ